MCGRYGLGELARSVLHRAPSTLMPKAEITKKDYQDGKWYGRMAPQGREVRPPSLIANLWGVCLQTTIAITHLRMARAIVTPAKRASV